MKKIVFTEPKSKLRKLIEFLLLIVGGLVFVYAVFVTFTSYNKPPEELNQRLTISQRACLIHVMLTRSSSEISTKPIA